MPSATKLEIYECCAALTNESVAELRLLYSVKLIQVRWRQLRKDRVLFARLRELEERISTLRAAHEISSSQLGPGASAEQIAARDVSVRHLQGLMVEATALRRHLTPHDRLADLLAREYVPDLLLCGNLLTHSMVACVDTHFIDRSSRSGRKLGRRRARQNWISRCPSKERAESNLPQ